jgi:DNA-binding transcriptional regulator YdaS (Cro superfamily)
MTDTAAAAEPTGKPDNMVALDEAIEKVGGVGVLAQRIGARAQSVVSMWRARGSVPAEYCPAIERETGIPCERLNPKVDWATVRQNPDPAANEDQARAAS